MADHWSVTGQNCMTGSDFIQLILYFQKLMYEILHI